MNHTQTIGASHDSFFFLLSSFLTAEALEPEEAGIVDHGDGTYHFALPKGFDPDELVVDSIFRWQYIGQATISYSDEHFPQTIVEVGPEDDELPKRRVMTKVDRLGRMWLEIGRDQEQALLDSEEYKSGFFEDYDVEGEAVRTDTDRQLRTGEERYRQLLGWNHLDCDNSSPFLNETHIWDTDSRTYISPWSTTLRQRSVVQVIGSGGRCTGTLIRQKWVLTAAHCVWDNVNNNAYVPQGFSVKRVDVNEVRDVEAIFVESGYSNGNEGVKRDWALLKLVDDWDVPAETMGLSQAPDATLENLTNVHNVSFPQFADVPGLGGGSCGAADGTHMFSNQEWEPLHAVRPAKVKLDIDVTHGQSGSGFFYCPAGDDNVCGAGEHGFIFSVLSSYDQVWHYAEGAKVSAFRQDALDVINNN